ncbi:hypothetical protein [Herbidospora sp. NBRC 101105]|uniref:hypothetical protein n=1 Tax=Herbidospora sp. NBRC 101105 TaxID=3032195 RepID=UPI0024A2A433|nr:hypothetical protein [Herbidospora sp. NBRC 101105]GLX99511.1 hypothetical protein Hesp01_74610 [Herbidospora sp. NBRC 101105]
MSRLRQLADANPDRLAIAAALISAVTQYAAARWTQVAVDDVINILHDPTRRVVHTSTDLLKVVLETLEEIGDALPPQGELLWDRIPGQRKRGNQPEIPDLWQPKPEAALCAYVAHELRLRMARHGVVVNREVLIQSTDAFGGWRPYRHPRRSSSRNTPRVP